MHQVLHRNAFGVIWSRNLSPYRSCMAHPIWLHSCARCRRHCSPTWNRISTCGTWTPTLHRKNSRGFDSLSTSRPTYAVDRACMHHNTVIQVQCDSHLCIRSRILNSNLLLFCSSVSMEWCTSSLRFSTFSGRGSSWMWMSSRSYSLTESSPPERSFGR